MDLIPVIAAGIAKEIRKAGYKVLKERGRLNGYYSIYKYTKKYGLPGDAAWPCIIAEMCIGPIMGVTITRTRQTHFELENPQLIEDILKLLKRTRC